MQLKLNVVNEVGQEAVVAHVLPYHATKGGGGEFSCGVKAAWQVSR